MGESKLKPCPFCGDTPAVGITFYKSSGSEVLLKAIVYCQRCKISRYKIFKATDGYDGITPFFDYEVAMDTAKKLWNRRVNDDAMDMAIEALKCSETPKSSEQNAETAQADHIAESGKKVEQTADYPISDFSTVTDSWSTIIANANYATDYSVGDIKLVDFGTFGQHYFELVAMDEDTKADGTGKARMTWLNKNFLTTHVMNATATTTGGYDASNMKSWITSDVLPQLQSEIRNAIVPVTKISGTYENSAIVVNGQSTTESLWIPSEYEMFGTTTYENTGARYSKFDSNAKRIKYNSGGSASYWWLRSAYSTSSFRFVNNGGYAGISSANYAFGVVLGFCI